MSLAVMCLRQDALSCASGEMRPHVPPARCSVMCLRRDALLCWRHHFDDVAIQQCYPMKHHSGFTIQRYYSDGVSLTSVSKIVIVAA